MIQVGHDIAREKWQKGLPRIDKIGTEFDLTEAARLVATEDEWHDYADTGYEQAPLTWSMSNSLELRQEWRYYWKAEVEAKLFKKIRQKVLDGSWQIYGNREGAVEYTRINPRHFKSFPNLFRWSAIAGSLEYENLIFKRNAKLKISKSTKVQQEAEAIDFLKKWSKNRRTRVSVSDINQLISDQFPDYHFGNKALLRIRNGANLKEKGIIGSGPIPPRNSK